MFRSKFVTKRIVSEDGVVIAEARGMVVDFHEDEDDRHEPWVDVEVSCEQGHYYCRSQASSRSQS